MPLLRFFPTGSHLSVEPAPVQPCTPSASARSKWKRSYGRCFPRARLARMDRDTTRAKAAHQRILRTLGSGDIDILVGTQMIAKGHDYPNITLVGVVSADATLAIPDFRAPERLFQLLTQVAGPGRQRAGPWARLSSDLPSRALQYRFCPTS